MSLLALVELGTPPFDPDEVRRVTEDVLARPEYRETDPSFLDRALGWIFEHLGRLLEAAGGGAAPILAGAVLLVLVLAVVVLAVRFGGTVSRDRDLPRAVPGRVGRPPADWAREASQHESAGRWRDAVRCRYRALVAELAAAGLVREVPGRTAGEYLGELVRAAPDARAPFAAVTRRFEGTWYGEERADATTVAALAEDGAAVRAATGLRSRGAPVSATAASRAE